MVHGAALGDGCCHERNRDDLAALAEMCGVDWDPECGHWRSQCWEVFDDVAVVEDPVPEIVYESADAVARTSCRADCPIAIARSEADHAWRERCTEYERSLAKESNE
jgi:hypothetical protein